MPWLHTEPDDTIQRIVSAVINKVGGHKFGFYDVGHQELC